MKKVLFTAIAFATLLVSCKKGTLNLPEDSGCIEQVFTPVNGHAIGNADVGTVDALFRNNNIDHKRYRYYQYNHDTVQTYYPPYTPFDEKLVRVEEYTNGLPIFTGQLIFSFKNNVFNFRGGNPTNGTNLNTTPKLRLAQLRKLFLDAAENFDHKGAEYRDSCLSAEFGYFNLNAGTGNPTEKLVKAWRVVLGDARQPFQYPEAFYKDDDGELIYYDNGIRTFK